MSFYNLYVGDASDPKFHWEGGDHSYNIPSIILDLGSLGLGGCVDAMRLLENAKYGGRVLDWGSTGARLTKAQIIEFLIELNSPYLANGATLAKIQALEGDQEFILFACEQ